MQRIINLLFFFFFFPLNGANLNIIRISTIDVRVDQNICDSITFLIDVIRIKIQGTNHLLKFSHSIFLKAVKEAENANSKCKQEKRQNLKRVLVIIITINSPRHLYYFLHPYLLMIMQTRRVQYMPTLF